MTPGSETLTKADTSEAGKSRLGTFFRKRFRPGRRGRKRPRPAAVEPGLAQPGRVCGWAGWNAVFGLRWQSKGPPPISGPPVAVRWRGVYATSAERQHAGMVPLAALIADSLGINPLQSEWQGATVIAVAKSSESLYWAAILADGEPLPGRHEMSFRDVDALNAWVQTECRPGEVARLYASRGVLRDVQVTVESWQLDEEDAANPELVPVFEVRAMPRLARATGGLAALGMVLFGGWTAADEFYFSRLNREGETRMVAFETPIDLFLANCHEELRKPWPVPPGWQTESSGCTTSSMDDPHVLQVPFAGGSAYRMFSLAAGHDGTLARAAAKQLLAGFDGWWSVDDQAILLQRPVDVPLRPAGAGQPTVFEELRVETEGIFLGLGAEIVIENDTIVLTSSASVPTVVRLLVELHRRQPISLNRFTRSREGLQVVLLPRQTIMVAESQPASS